MGNHAYYKYKANKYISEKFGRLFHNYRWMYGSTKQAAEYSHKKLGLNLSTVHQYILGLEKGNLLGSCPFIGYHTHTKKEDFALRISNILYALGVPQDSEMIKLARDTLKVDFKYPPTEPFPIRKYAHGPRIIRDKTILERLNKLNPNQEKQAIDYLDWLTSKPKPK